MPNIDFGVREWVNLMVTMLELYLRHKENIDALLNDPTKSAMDVLAASLNLIAAMNVEGPDPNVPAEGSLPL